MLKVAIIDDEPWIVRGLEKSLDWASLGLEIVYSGTRPQEAIEQICCLMPEIVITDINMGAISGIAFMAKLRSNGLACEFIVISGYDDFEFARQSMALGVKHYLLKPVDRNELEAVVRAVMTDVQMKRIIEREGGLSKDVLSDDRFEEMRKYVAINCHMALYLSDLSENFHYNATYISDMFKKKLGIGFSEFLTQCRLEKAMLMLTQTKKPIMEVAEACGFQDAGHFSRLFRKHYGIAPRDSRKAVGGERL